MQHSWEEIPLGIEYLPVSSLDVKCLEIPIPNKREVRTIGILQCSCVLPSSEKRSIPKSEDYE